MPSRPAPVAPPPAADLDRETTRRLIDRAARAVAAAADLITLNRAAILALRRTLAAVRAEHVAVDGPA